MQIKLINLTRKSYALFPCEGAVITIKRRSFLSVFRFSMLWEKEWAGLVK
jgi:hypothetical protein